jgi:hypothetical protein
MRDDQPVWLVRNWRGTATGTSESEREQIEAWRIDTHRRDQLAEGCAHTQVYADGRPSLTQCFSASESGSGGFIPWMVQKSIGVWSMWTSQR